MTPAAFGDAPGHTLLKMPFTLRDLSRLRLHIECLTAPSGLTELTRGTFLIAVDAVATSAIEHGNSGTLLLRQSHESLECRIDASGLACEAPNGAPRENECEKSRWGCNAGLVTRIADRLSIPASATGTTVTLSVRLPSGKRPESGTNERQAVAE